MSAHGTHVTSLIFGQPNTSVLGVAPRCQGLLLPVFRDFQEGRLSQLDLARAIEQAVQEGAQIINISGGERSPQGQADEILSRAIRLCGENNVLVVAAVGNDGCECLHVPAALPAVLAVGAMDAGNQPLGVSNWGKSYRSNGVLAPGESIRGAVPGGTTALKTGSSFATPIVAGFAALLLSVQKRTGQKLNPRAVRQTILESVHKCDPAETADCRRYLSGSLNISGAYDLIRKAGHKPMSLDNASQMVAQTPGIAAIPPAIPAMRPGVVAAGVETSETSASAIAAAAPPSQAPSPVAAVMAVPTPEGVSPSGGPPPAALNAKPPADSAPAIHTPSATSSGIVPSCACGGNGKKQNVFAIGTISYDFGTEARRDTFRQLMPNVNGVPANPYDPRQIYSYLEYVNGQAGWQPATDYALNDLIVDPNGNNQLVISAGTSGDQDHPPQWNSVFGETTQDGDKKSGVTWRNAGPRAFFGGKRPNAVESTKLIWTLNLELTPIYALIAEVPYADEVYSVFRSALYGETLKLDDPGFVGRVSVPGVLTGRTVRLFSGQELPETRVQARGLWTWNVNAILQAVVDSVKAQQPPDHPLSADDERSVRQFVQNFLDKVYYELRNLGQSSSDRALNYSATNVFQAAAAAAALINPAASGKIPSPNFYTLDSISVAKSPYCRIDSDCWDVQLIFFDPVNIMQARIISQFTVDVSDELPVTMGPVRTWTSAAGVTIQR